ncbi:MAG: transposase [Nitrospiraceae bacterium]|nr:transposase [Nitrospiraceae bacterium]
MGVAEAKPHVHQFMSIADAQAIIEAWRVDYNQHRLHRSLRHLTPNEVVIQCQANEVAEEVVYSGRKLSPCGADVNSHTCSPLKLSS